LPTLSPGAVGNIQEKPNRPKDGASPEREMKKQSRTRAESMRDLRAARRDKGWISARFDCTPDEKRKLQICLDRLRKVAQ